MTRIRVAKRFARLEGRRSLVADRLMAFFVLLQASPNHDDMAAFFLTEGEFVSELVGLLEADDAVPEDVRILALRALAVQVCVRPKAPALPLTSLHVWDGSHCIGLFKGFLLAAAGSPAA